MTRHVLIKHVTHWLYLHVIIGSSMVQTPAVQNKAKHIYLIITYTPVPLVVSRSIVFCVVFCRSLFVLLFWAFVLSSTDNYWLPLWYLQSVISKTNLKKKVHQGSWSYGICIYNYLFNQCVSHSFVSSNLTQARCTRYNIMWWSLSVTCDRSVVFFGCSGVLHQ
jgi:hypothetical protein